MPPSIIGQVSAHARFRAVVVSTALALAASSLSSAALAALPAACSLITPGEVQSVAGVDPNKTTEHGVSDSCYYLDNAPSGRPEGSQLTRSLTLYVTDSSRAEWDTIVSLNAILTSSGFPVVAVEVPGLGDAALWRTDHSGTSGTAEYDLRVFSSDAIVTLAVNTETYGGDDVALGALGDEAQAILSRLGGTPAVSLPDNAAYPVSSDDITACLPMSNIERLLGQPTKFNAGDDAQHANFTGPSGATLQVERALSDGAAVYQEHLDEGLAQSGWQLAGVDGLGDKAFAADRGGDSRSLVILQGDSAWLLHMDGVPAGSGFPQLGAVARAALNACP